MKITLLGFALAIDAAVVTFAMSLLHERDSKWMKLKNAFLVSFTFGLFQCLMLWLGSYGGYLFTFSRFGHYIQIIIGLTFLGLGFKCVQESTENGKKVEWGIVPVIFLGIATSIDALAAGISLGTIPRPSIAAAEVGLITFGICSFFYFSGQFFRNIPDRWLLRFAGGIFLFLGGQVFWTI
jgi:putative Mn2+ efflux pump MntP